MSSIRLKTLPAVQPTEALEKTVTLLDLRLGSQENIQVLSLFSHFDIFKEAINTTTSVYLRPLLRFITTNIFRLKLDVSVKKVVFLESETGLEPLEKDNVVEFRDCSEEEEVKTEELYLKFKFPTYEEFSKIPGINVDKDHTFNAELALSSKFELKSGEKSVLFDGDVLDQEDEHDQDHGGLVVPEPLLHVGVSERSGVRIPLGGGGIKKQNEN
ncbi:hypothetical protein CASFOL_030593 [Castilleja foliolosa]|uniref:Uncharacterized protein n=1 Tax=Castilleja foliolosa TaxID=1961234 RepID=A0ABD3C6C0_9LAMI